LGNFDNLREKEYLRKEQARLDLKRKIYSANIIELVETIKDETNKLFANLPVPAKTNLQKNLVFFCVNYMDNLNTLLTDTTLNITQTFLTQRKIKDLTKQDIHRLIMILALNAYTQSNSEGFAKEAKKLQDLVRKMVLIK
jgi:hypothetical protein